MKWSFTAVLIAAWVGVMAHWIPSALPVKMLSMKEGANPGAQQGLMR